MAATVCRAPLSGTGSGRLKAVMTTSVAAAQVVAHDRHVLEDEGYDVVSARPRYQSYRRWRSPLYWVGLVATIAIALLVALTAGGLWYLIPLGLWPVVGHLIDRHLHKGRRSTSVSN